MEISSLQLWASRRSASLTRPRPRAPGRGSGRERLGSAPTGDYGGQGKIVSPLSGEALSSSSLRELGSWPTWAWPSDRNFAPALVRARSQRRAAVSTPASPGSPRRGLTPTRVA